MHISENGVDLIRRFEGYQKRLKNGSCTAYQDTFRDPKTGKVHVDVPTCGYGSTVGVTMGMVWTEAEAEAALRRELAAHEAAITQMVTVPLNQNEFDALVSLSYNVGSGAVSKSRLLKALNAGDKVTAANGFLPFSRAGGIVVDGLVSRRMREAALFLKPTAQPSEPYMPQTVQETPPPASTSTKLGVGALSGYVSIEGAKAVVGQGQDIKTVASDGLDLIRPVQPYLQPHVLVAGGILLAALIAVILLRRTS